MLSMVKVGKIISTLSSRSLLQFTAVRALSSYPSHAVISMPSLSPTMAAGTIASWSKKVGDKVAPGDSYAEVETDKATMAFEVQEEGYIAKILAEAGKEITVGTPILITVESADDIKAFEKYEVVATATPAAAAAPAASQPAPTPTPAPAPVVSAPTPAPASVVTAPTPSPAPVIATPSAAPAPSNNSSEPTFLYSKSWNKKTVSVLAPKIRAEHAAYLAKFGRTGHKSI